MTAKEFEDYVFDNADKDYGICPPPIEAKVGMDILIEHLLGKDWYTSLSLGVEQVYTEAIYAILKKYPKKGEL